MVYEVGKYVVVKRGAEDRATRPAVIMFRKINGENMPLVGKVIKTVNVGRDAGTIVLGMPAGYEFNSIWGHNINGLAPESLGDIDQALGEQLYNAANSRMFKMRGGN